jgi:MerR family copper efflux transcriptional regulator
MKAGNETMTVGTAARRAGVKIDTIRYYERRALLPKSPRTEAGYRTLTDETVQRVRFIKHAQALGFTLNEIKQLLALRLTLARRVRMSEAAQRRRQLTSNERSARSRS